MWLLDKIKRGYKRTINNFFSFAVRIDSARLARAAIYLGADPFVWGYDGKGIVYPSLTMCRSSAMLTAVIDNSENSNIHLNNILVFAAQHDLLRLAELALDAGANPETPVTAVKLPLILSPSLSEDMRDALINATIFPKYNTSDPKNATLYRCLKWLRNSNISKHAIIIKWANKLVENFFGSQDVIDYIDQESGNTVLHALAACPAPISEDVCSLFEKILWKSHKLPSIKNAVGLTPTDLIYNSPHKEEWLEGIKSRFSLEKPKPLIVDKYASMKDMPPVNPVLQSDEVRLFLGANSRKISV